MKLSEAIRLGAMTGPQAFGTFQRKIRTGFLGIFGPKTQATCAFGAAMEAAGIKEEPGVVGEGASELGFRGGVDKPGTRCTVVKFPDHWNRLIWEVVPCPECGHAQPLMRVVTELNDKHRWTRERIAQFVASIEESETCDEVLEKEETNA